MSTPGAPGSGMCTFPSQSARPRRVSPSRPATGQTKPDSVRPAGPRRSGSVRPATVTLRPGPSDGSAPAPSAQMPIQPASKDAEEMEAEGDSATEMNGEEEESEEERSGSQTESEEESSEMDDEDYERRRSECVSEMLDLEKQFSELKEKLFRERLSQLRVRLEEVGAERAPEYTEPLGGLQKSLKIRIQVAGIYKGFCLDVIRNKYECELQGAKQHLESEKLLLYDSLQGELQERIQRLEEDRQSLDLSSGPYIVYMLQEIDILEDWTAIKKARAAVSPQKRKSDGKNCRGASPRATSDQGPASFGVIWA
ncbi:Breast cancer metastasis-suppressor 1 [Galemys pyrenaicus]|uniref:Breast cancer metastasis-suppressor 1 n=1 Tax=Galemys pyrenaicus TaxID=202257 RepID=A0A8J6AJ77_GALPY|nr:Breast cancer metastasis-suppressor 1 [Galemys pyrenaicus]